jgi:hypothetical protein
MEGADWAGERHEQSVKLAAYTRLKDLPAALVEAGGATSVVRRAKRLRQTARARRPNRQMADAMLARPLATRAACLY